MSTEFVTIGEFRQEIAAIKARLTGLENLANRMGYTVDVPDTDTIGESVSDTDAPSVNATTGDASGVDYAAVAYGLSDMRAKIARQFGSSAEVNAEFRGAIDWFVACFAGDASFNEAEFRRNAGV